MKSIYYAHSMNIYDTPQEKRDIKILEDLGFKVINPNTKEISNGFKDWNIRYPNREDYMDYFNNMVKECDTLAFRSFVDGTIPSGIVSEIQTALKSNMPVIELPILTSNRFLDSIETRLYLEYLGQR